MVSLVFVVGCSKEVYCNEKNEQTAELGYDIQPGRIGVYFSSNYNGEEAKDILDNIKEIDDTHSDNQFTIVYLNVKEGTELEWVCDMQEIEPRISEAVLEVLEPRHSVNSRISFGGTAPDQVVKAIATARKELE